MNHETPSHVSNWFAQNPGAFATLASACVAASVAFLVAVLTQFVTSRRDQIKFLTGKLEELYLLFNKSAEDNVTRFEGVDKWFHGILPEKRDIEKIDDLYGLNHNKRIIMLIRLYFPNLSFLHQQLFHTQRNLNDLYYSLFNGDAPSFEKFIQASGKLAHFLRLIEGEIIANRKKLTRDYWFFCRYKKTSHRDLEYVHNPPPGSPSTRAQQDVAANDRPAGATQGLGESVSDH